VISVTLSQDITGLLCAIRKFTNSLIYLLMSMGKHSDVGKVQTQDCLLLWTGPAGMNLYQTPWTDVDKSLAIRTLLLTG